MTNATLAGALAAATVRASDLLGLCLLLSSAAASACHPSAGAPTAPGPSTAAPVAPAPLPPDARPEATLSAEALAACVPSPPLEKRPTCGLRGKLGPEAAVCSDFAPQGSPDVDVLTLLVAPAPLDFAATLGIPSVVSALDAGTPGLAAMKQVYRDFEGPAWSPLADGRRARLEGRGLMLGGVVHWATLPSPGGTFDSVVVRYIPLHDAPLTDADRQAIETWDLARLAECVDAAFFGRGAPTGALPR